MSKQISVEILKAMNEIANNEIMIAKLDAAIFVKNCQNMINEKIAYLYNMMKIEAHNCNQKKDDSFKEIEFIITIYKQKLELVYDVFYEQYANIQNELQEANTNRKIAIIHYQNIINELEENSEMNLETKKIIEKKKNENYHKVIQMCKEKFDQLFDNFEKVIMEEFSISSNSLQIISEQNILQKMVRKFSNLFQGKKKYTIILEEYKRKIGNINTNNITQKIKSDTIEFIADIMEIKEIDLDELA